MILEVAVLDVIAGRTPQFEINFNMAKKLISSIEGFADLQLQRCLEQPNRYILLVNWDTLESHTTGFRQSAVYQEWKKLLHEFYNPFPVVQHYELINEA
ncbi:antibiotic biosynthesis monooxygenase [Chitinophaga sp. MM2321]|uniref:antibiotic biosynthesis monooxygenase family protein n=1 Tax=Chitinophaga sp. MM2321 TaxID=3137178 RepID=UPI0032D590A8